MAGTVPLAGRRLQSIECQIAGERRAVLRVAYSDEETRQEKVQKHSSTGKSTYIITGPRSQPSPLREVNGDAHVFQQLHVAFL